MYFRLDIQACQRIIGLACFQYLKQINWKVQDPDKSTDKLKEQYPLLQYASYYMASHLLNSDVHIEELLSNLEGFPALETFLLG
jgi:hypothetical protein